MSGFEVVVVVIVVLVWLGLIALVMRGWRNRGRRQSDLIGTPPAVPDGLPAPTRGPDSGLYVGSTIAPSWQDRVAVGDLGDRAAAAISSYPQGILIERQGASDIWIPRPSITAIRTERGLAGKVMTADGVLVIRWVLPSGTEIDSGVRADDKSSYPGWVTEDPRPDTADGHTDVAEPGNTDARDTETEGAGSGPEHIEQGKDQ